METMVNPASIADLVTVYIFAIHCIAVLLLTFSFLGDRTTYLPIQAPLFYTRYSKR